MSGGFCGQSVRAQITLVNPLYAESGFTLTAMGAKEFSSAAPNPDGSGLLNNAYHNSAALKVLHNTQVGLDVNEYVFLCEIRPLNKPRLSAQYVLPKSEVVAQVRTKQLQTSVGGFSLIGDGNIADGSGGSSREVFLGEVTVRNHLISSTTSSNVNNKHRLELSVIFNSMHHSWDYSWRSNRWSATNEKHVVDIVALRYNALSPNDFVVSACYTSSPFYIVSSHKKPGQRLVSSDMEVLSASQVLSGMADLSHLADAAANAAAVSIHNAATATGTSTSGVTNTHTDSDVPVNATSTGSSTNPSTNDILPNSMSNNVTSNKTIIPPSEGQRVVEVQKALSDAVVNLSKPSNTGNNTGTIISTNTTISDSTMSTNVTSNTNNTTTMSSNVTSNTNTNTTTSSSDSIVYTGFPTHTSNISSNTMSTNVTSNTNTIDSTNSNNTAIRGTKRNHSNNVNNTMEYTSVPLPNNTMYAHTLPPIPPMYGYTTTGNTLVYPTYPSHPNRLVPAGHQLAYVPVLVPAGSAPSRDSITTILPGNMPNHVISNPYGPPSSAVQQAALPTSPVRPSEGERERGSGGGTGTAIERERDHKAEESIDEGVQSLMSLLVRPTNYEYDRSLGERKRMRGTESAGSNMVYMDNNMSSGVSSHSGSSNIVNTSNTGNNTNTVGAGKGLIILPSRG